MTFFEDHITFTIDSRYEEVAKSGIILLNKAWVDPEESERFIHKRIYGTVTSVPQTYSDTNIKAVDPGLPTPKAFVGHDWIVDKINRGYTNHSNKDYYPSTFDGYEFRTLADIAKMCDIQVGDTVYFDEKVTEMDNYLGILDEKEHFRARIDEVFCVVREEKKSFLFGSTPKRKILMQGGWVLVDPEMETWSDITTKSGIIKKVKPEPKPLLGVIAHVREHKFMKQGQRIIYKSDADWTLKVEEKQYYVIQEDDILGEN